jgi:hypothetical protein
MELSAIFCQVGVQAKGRMSDSGARKKLEKIIYQEFVKFVGIGLSGSTIANLIFFYKPNFLF